MTNHVILKKCGQYLVGIIFEFTVVNVAKDSVVEWLSALPSIKKKFMTVSAVQVS